MDTLVSFGEQAPLFTLPDLKGNSWALEDFRGMIVVLNFWSAECDWCQRVDSELVTYLDAWKERVKASGGGPLLKQRRR